MANDTNNQMNMRVQADDEMTIDILELIMVVLRKWVIVAFATVVLAAAGFGYSKFMLVPQYSATAQLFVLSKTTSITSIADIQLGTLLTNDYVIVTTGRPVLDQVISNLGLDETYRTLKRKVTINNPDNTRILEITVIDEEPKRAKAIADEIAVVASAFISEKMDQDPPSIISFAYADGNPIESGTKKNTMLGGLAGFVISAGLIVFIYLINDTINTSEDVEKKLGLKLIASIPLDESVDDRGRKIKKNSSSHRLFKKKKKKQYR